MSGHVHTAKCLEYRKKLEADHMEWKSNWPKSCGKCGGWGGHKYGATYWEPEYFEECPACVEKGHCPRCGESLGIEEKEYYDNLTCTACGWNDTEQFPGDPTTDAETCICYFEEVNND